MRFRAAAAAIVLAMALPACSGAGSGFFRQYEYEEEVYLSLDGTATVYVNASVPALDALRGFSLDPSPNAAVDRDAVGRLFTSPVTHLDSRVTTSRRGGRRFVHVKLAVDDIRQLSQAAPFAWSHYAFSRDGDIYRYGQVVGPPVGKDVGNVGWNGREIVAFRLHLPSRIQYHNSGRDVARGNILIWEQLLSDRLRNAPLTLDARMDTQSILYTTLWLFGVTALGVVLAFVLVIWWVYRRAPVSAPEASH
jgi:hypothetical protein